MQRAYGGLHRVDQGEERGGYRAGAWGGTEGVTVRAGGSQKASSGSTRVGRLKLLQEIPHKPSELDDVLAE